MSSEAGARPAVHRVGAVGAGKTTLVERLVEQMPASQHVALLHVAAGARRAKPTAWTIIL